MLSRRFIMTFLICVVNVGNGCGSLYAAEPKNRTSSADEGCLEDEAVPQATKGVDLAEALRPGEAMVDSTGKFEAHNWVPFPKFSGRSILTNELFQASSKDDRGAIVLTFLASWCIPCQKLVPLLQKLESKYQSHYTDFYYVFGHDTKQDASGFVKEYKLGERALFGSAEFLEAFHQPELPTIYVRDRYRWMYYRFRRPCPKHIEEIDRFLEQHTAF